MTINRYDLGDSVRLSATFTNAAGTASDPGVVTFKARKPGGTVVIYVYGTGAELVRESAGLYQVDIVLDVVGRWHYRFEGTVSGQAAAEHEFVVSPSRFD